jgi:hypothetical protein
MDLEIGVSCKMVILAPRQLNCVRVIPPFFEKLFLHWHSHMQAGNLNRKGKLKEEMVSQ